MDVNYTTIEYSY